jgi:membrane-associated phospholipid phosphatase
MSANGPPSNGVPSGRRSFAGRGAEPAVPRDLTHDLAHAWGMAAVVATAVVAICAILAANGILPGETAVRDAVLSVSSARMRALSRTIRPLGTWWGIAPGVLLLLAVSRHARRRWWLWSLSLVLAPLAGEALQEFVGRLRPTGPAYGFPSGHATATAAFAVAVIYLLGRSPLARPLRAVITVTAVTLTVLIGISRIVLDAHWPLDVVAGFALGAAGAAAAAWWDASHPPAGPE